MSRKWISPLYAFFAIDNVRPKEGKEKMDTMSADSLTKTMLIQCLAFIDIQFAVGAEGKR